jgi:hypothetical protein
VCGCGCGCGGVVVVVRLLLLLLSSAITSGRNDIGARGISEEAPPGRQWPPQEPGPGEHGVRPHPPSGARRRARGRYAHVLCRRKQVVPTLRDPENPPPPPPPSIKSRSSADIARSGGSAAMETISWRWVGFCRRTELCVACDTLPRFCLRPMGWSSRLLRRRRPGTEWTPKTSPRMGDAAAAAAAAAAALSRARPLVGSGSASSLERPSPTSRKYPGTRCDQWTGGRRCGISWIGGRSR